MLLTLTPIWIAYFLAAAAPGPSQIYVVECSTFGGRARGRIAALGISLGTAVWVTLVAFGLGHLVQAFSLGPTLLKVASIGLLAYFFVRTVVQLITGGRQPVDARHPVAIERLHSTFIKGVLVNVLNPNSVVFFLSLFAPMLVDAHDSRTLSICVLGVMILSVGWYQTLVTLASHPRIQSFLKRSEKPMRAMFAAFYLYFLIRALVRT